MTNAASTNLTGTCPRCDGAGNITAFRHVANGDCFLCGATGTIDYSTPYAGNKVQWHIQHQHNTTTGVENMHVWANNSSRTVAQHDVRIDDNSRNEVRQLWRTYVTMGAKVAKPQVYAQDWCSGRTSTTGAHISCDARPIEGTAFCAHCTE